MMFPFDFGFLPSTLGEDGDPLDIMVLMDAPAHVGCLIEVRVIGIITADQTEDGKTESNNRLIGAAVHSYDHEDVKSLGDISKTLLDQVEELSSRTTSSAARNSRSPEPAARRRRSGS